MQSLVRDENGLGEEKWSDERQRRAEDPERD